MTSVPSSRLRRWNTARAARLADVPERADDLEVEASETNRPAFRWAGTDDPRTGPVSAGDLRDLLAFLALRGLLRALEEAVVAEGRMVRRRAPGATAVEPVGPGVRGDDRGHRGHRRDALGGAA